MSDEITQPDAAEGGALDNIQIEFVEEPVQVRVNMACLTWGDLLAIQKQMSGEQTEEDSEKMFTAIVSKVTGQDAYALPAQVMAKLIPLIVQRAQGIVPKA